MNGKKQGLPMGALIALLASALLGGAASDALAWATITVNTLADPGASGVCALRDAITAANTHTPTNGCVAGKGNDTIQFSVTGTIKLADTLPEVIDSQLTINGPITIDGGNAVRGMEVASAATLNLQNVTIANCKSFQVGFQTPASGIFNQGTLNVANSTFTANGSSGSQAGAVNNFGEMTIINSTFSGNTAGVSGGAIGNLGTVTVSNTTFSENSAPDNAGAIANAGELTVTNSTFFKNHADNPGGGISNAGNLTVINSTFLDNSSNAVGGDIVNQTVASLRGTIVAGKATAGNCYHVLGTFTDLGYNISDDDSCGFTAVGSLNNTDPMLSPAGLADNGGPTQTIALLPGSPAIDALPLSSCTDQDGNPLTTDQRGFPRPDAGEQVCDIGAYEFQDFAGTPGTKNCQGVSVSALAREFRNITAAASALHFPNVQALHKAIQAFCSA